MNNEEAFNVFKSNRFPKMLQFETSTKCNASCKMCPHGKMTPREDMKWSQITKLIREIVPHVNEVCPFLMQEPSLEKRLVSILSNIKQINPYARTTVYTNMGGWSPELTDRVVERGNLDGLHISFYAPNKRLYHKWQKGLNYRRTVKNIEYLLSKVEEKPSVVFHYVSIPELIGKDGRLLKRFVNRWGKYAYVGLVHYDTFHGKVPDYGDNRLGFGEPNMERTPCPRLWSGLNIHSDGTMVPCCIDFDQEYPIGNVFEEHPHKLWKSDRFDELRQLHVKGKYDEIDLCRDCKLFEYQHPKEWDKLWLS